MSLGLPKTCSCVIYGNLGKRGDDLSGEIVLARLALTTRELDLCRIGC